MPFSDANEPTERPNHGHGISRNARLAAANPLTISCIKVRTFLLFREVLFSCHWFFMYQGYNLNPRLRFYLEVELSNQIGNQDKSRPSMHTQPPQPPRSG
jgi:hypothetical protein